MFKLSQEVQHPDHAPVKIDLEGDSDRVNIKILGSFGPNTMTLTALEVIILRQMLETYDAVQPEL
jgi:hypothetical protein